MAIPSSVTSSTKSSRWETPRFAAYGQQGVEVCFLPADMNLDLRNTLLRLLCGEAYARSSVATSPSESECGVLSFNKTCGVTWPAEQS